LFSKTPHIDKNKKISQNWSIAKTKNECLEFVPNTKFSLFQIFYPMCRKFVPNLRRRLISGLKTLGVSTGVGGDKQGQNAFFHIF